MPFGPMIQIEWNFKSHQTWDPYPANFCERSLEVARVNSGAQARHVKIVSGVGSAAGPTTASAISPTA